MSWRESNFVPSFSPPFEFLFLTSSEGGPVPPLLPRTGFGPRIRNNFFDLFFITFFKLKVTGVNKE